MKPSTISERLEHIRASLGIASVKAFHLALTNGWSTPVVYRSTTNYQTGVREPPAAYLTRVCEVFGASPTYLLTGEGPPFEAERTMWALEEETLALQDEWRRTRLDEFWHECGLAHLPYHVRHQFLEVWSSLNGTGWFYSAVTEHLRLDIGRGIHRQLLGTFGKQGRPDVRSDEFVDYAMAMLFAIALAVRVPFTSPKGNGKKS